MNPFITLTSEKIERDSIKSRVTARAGELIFFEKVIEDPWITKGILEFDFEGNMLKSLSGKYFHLELSYIDSKCNDDLLNEINILMKNWEKIPVGIIKGIKKRLKEKEMTPEDSAEVLFCFLKYLKG